MRKQITRQILTALTVFGAMTALLTAGEPNAAEELGMTQATFAQGRLSIDYCEKVFRYGPTPMCLVLLWHGGSGKGNDNLAQLTTPSLIPLISYLQLNRRNAVILVPQCPKSAVSWLSGNATSPMMATRALVRSKVASYHIASNNISFAGISMGGTAAYSLFTADIPNLFAKAIVCSGAGDTSLAPSITAEVRIFNGAEDTVIAPEAGLAMADAINAAGGRATYYLLHGYDHRSAADIAFSLPQWDWLFGHKRHGFVVSIQ